MDMKDTIRFWSKVQKTDECWLWGGHICTQGYGQMNVRGRDVLAHRLSYQLLVGEIPEGLELDHLCRIRTCVNPAHLEPVTHAENMKRMLNSVTRPQQILCKQGHVLDGIRTRKTGGRYCKTCNLESKRRQRLGR